MKGIEIVANFEKDLKCCIRENILSLGNHCNSVNLKKEFGINDNTYWDSKTIKEILADYYNFIDRVIVPLPREVKITNNIQQSIYFSNRQSKIKEIQKKFELGESVNEYLSDKHTKNYRSKDKVFHLLGLHHLHINDTLPNGKIDKNKYKPVYLLIIALYQKNVYFLDIVLHKDFDIFDYMKYVKILKNEDLLKNNRYVTLVPDEHASNFFIHGENYNLTKYHELVSKNLNAFIPVNDDIFIPRGITNAGTLSDTIYYAAEVMIHIKHYKDIYLNIIGIHNILLKAKQYPKDVERYELKIKWGNFDLLRGIEIYLYADGLLIH